MSDVDLPLPREDVLALPIVRAPRGIRFRPMRPGPNEAYYSSREGLTSFEICCSDFEETDGSVLNGYEAAMGGRIKLVAHKLDTKRLYLHMGYSVVPTGSDERVSVARRHREGVASACRSSYNTLARRSATEGMNKKRAKRQRERWNAELREACPNRWPWYLPPSDPAPALVRRLFGEMFDSSARELLALERGSTAFEAKI